MTRDRKNSKDLSPVIVLGWFYIFKGVYGIYDSILGWMIAVIWQHTNEGSGEKKQHLEFHRKVEKCHAVYPN